MWNYWITEQRKKRENCNLLDCKNSARAVMNVTVCNCSFFRRNGRRMLMVDKWSGLAELLANLIEKYASDLDIDNMSNTETTNSVES